MPPRKVFELKSGIAVLFDSVAVRGDMFQSQIFSVAHQAMSRAFDRFCICFIWQFCVVIIYRSDETVDGEFIGKSFFAFAAAEAWDLAVLAFDGGFFGVAAIDMH